MQKKIPQFIFFLPSCPVYVAAVISILLLTNISTTLYSEEGTKDYVGTWYNNEYGVIKLIYTETNAEVHWKVPGTSEYQPVFLASIEELNSQLIKVLTTERYEFDSDGSTGRFMDATEYRSFLQNKGFDDELINEEINLLFAPHEVQYKLSADGNRITFNPLTDIEAVYSSLEP